MQTGVSDKGRYANSSASTSQEADRGGRELDCGIPDIPRKATVSIEEPSAVAATSRDHYRLALHMLTWVDGEHYLHSSYD